MGFQEVLSLGLIVGHMLASALGPPTDTIQELRLVSATSVNLWKLSGSSLRSSFSYD